MREANQRPPGNIRRDTEPHRGPLLLGLAVAGLGASAPVGCLSFLSIALAREKKLASHVDLMFAWIILLVALAALAVSLTVALLARHDLAEMRSGRVDQAGEWETETAYFMGRTCALVAALACVLQATALSWAP
jgi:hypothetical protein